MESVPANSSYNRQKNLRTILDTLRHRSGLTQRDLASLTGLQPSTVSNLVGLLRRNGFVNHMGRKPSGPDGGKRGVLLGPSPTGPGFLGISIGRRHMACTRVGLDGMMVPGPVVTYSQSASDLLSTLTHLIERSLDSFEACAVGIAVASIVHEGSVRASAGFGLEIANLAASVQDRLPDLDRIVVENDANCAAVTAEPNARSGALALVFNTDPHSIGGGLCMEQIYRGATGAAGELLPDGASDGSTDDLRCSTVVRFVDPSVVLLVVAPERRAGFASDHPLLMRELAGRNYRMVDYVECITAGAAELAYSRFIDAILQDRVREAA